ncbi:hypothetical protein A7P53_00140 [Acinetobacter defluvii]|uniref:BRO-N domain-containing protein n=1 Tax=Acinetobacter defluvii TaxID=1871111 RepID=UPI00148F4F4A|nr:BRO family protein [Acinetobacter defluvii]NNP71302.1 hypothetical protein [Acinetobacter defluvii]
MNSLPLSFNEVKFNPVPQSDGQIWLSSAELAEALDYKQVDSVTKIFNRNSDEFDFTMTQTVNLTVNNKNNELQNVKTRIFSLRGCHLVAMFARTSVAKLFRKWVLDVLAKEVGQPVAKTHKSEREPLTNAVNMFVAKTKHLNYSDAYKIVHQRFNVDHIEDIPYDAIPVAVEYVHHLIALYSNAEKQKFTDTDLQNIHALATHMIWTRCWWSEFGDFVKKLNPTVYGMVATHFNDGSRLAWQFVNAERKQELKECLDSFDWFTGTYQQKLPV